MALIEINKNNFDLEIELRYSSKIILQAKKYLKKESVFYIMLQQKN